MTRIRCKNRKTIIQVPALETGKPGPGNRIRTRPRIPEICLKLNFFRSSTFQAPHSGSGFNSQLIRNSFMCKVFKTSLNAITTGTKMICIPLSRMGGKVPRIGGYLTLGAMLGAATLPGKLLGAAGDTIDDEAYSISTSQKPMGVSWDSEKNRTNWMTQSGEVRTGYYNPGSTKVINSVSDGCKWDGCLAEGWVGDNYYFFAGESTNDMVHIIGTDGVEWRSFTVPHRNYSGKGLGFYDDYGSSLFYVGKPNSNFPATR